MNNQRAVAEECTRPGLVGDVKIEIAIPLVSIWPAYTRR